MNLQRKRWSSLVVFVGCLQYFAPVLGKSVVPITGENAQKDSPDILPRHFGAFSVQIEETHPDEDFGVISVNTRNGPATNQEHGQELPTEDVLNPVYYRATVHFVNLPYIEEFQQSSESSYRTASKLIIHFVEDLYTQTQGDQYATVIEFRDYTAQGGGTLVTFDIGSLYNDHEESIRTILKQAVDQGNIGNYTVDTKGFTFRLVRSSSETQGLVTCAHHEFQCNDGTCVDQRKMCDGTNDCADGADESDEWARCNVEPQILHFSEDRTVRAGDTIMLEVTVQDLGRGTVLWIKTPQKILTVGRSVVVEDNRLKIDHGVHPDGGAFYNLKIENCNANDSGQYELWIDLVDKKLTSKVRVDVLGGDSQSATPIPDERPSAPRCPPGQFQCRSGHCLPDDRKCDGYADCPDYGDDEQHCSDAENHQTTTPKTVQTRQPEPTQPARPVHSACQEDHYQCRSGHCLPNNRKCDQHPDCPDGDDEEACPTGGRVDLPRPGEEDVDLNTPTPTPTEGEQQPEQPHHRGSGCEPGNYQCQSGHCLPEARKCDQRRDCPDGDDEERCDEHPVPTDHSQNDRDHERPHERPDETDHSQNDRDHERPQERPEERPSPCGADYQCRSGHCLPAARKCDRRPDCPDGDDEERCDEHQQQPTPDTRPQRPDVRPSVPEQPDVPSRCPGEYECRSGHCLPLSRKCDSLSDCPDGDDEQNCPAAAACDQQEFRCGDGSCIDQRLKCNGRPDCRDRSDERDCGPSQCPLEHWQCTSGQCIQDDQLCDDVPDCDDSSDELPQNCPAEPTPFDIDEYTHPTPTISEHATRPTDRPTPRTPATTTVDPRINQSIAITYCPDGTDPEYSRYGAMYCWQSGICPEGFVCKKGICCVDNGRTNMCDHEEYECMSGECVGYEQRCDRVYDCRDGSDELHCEDFVPTRGTPVCRQHEFKCQSGSQCVPLQSRCDRRYDCEDSSDEFNCDNAPRACSGDEFQCRSGECVNNAVKCNGQYDCRDGSDEVDCQAVPTHVDHCYPTEYQCASGECIDAQLRCNRRPDCRDSSDERDCDSSNVIPRCTNGQFQCDNGQCIDGSLRCNRRQDCRDGSDEPADCFSGTGEQAQLTLQVSPTEQTIREGREAIFDCRTDGAPADLRWTKMNGPLPQTATDSYGRLTIPTVQLQDAGTYVCTAVTSNRQTKEFRATLTVEPFGPREQTGFGRCDSGEKTCQDGQCVKIEYVCDGEKDCRDGSDEYNCPPPGTCQPNEFKCDNGQCVAKNWVCDGENDCQDASDERNCGGRPSVGVCTASQYACADRQRQQCVQLSFQCDGTNDCFDGSDEHGCAPPTAITPPVPALSVQRGETIIITCKAIGVPTPIITWRKNWGPVCPPPRCTQTSDNGFGTLTILNAETGDAGAYTCEALNVKGRILVQPDCIVSVGDGGQCHPAGSVQIGSGRQCQCKRFTTGEFCDRCAQGAFWLDMRNPHGCIQCFCSGITKTCSSTSWHRTQVRWIHSAGADRQNVIGLSDLQERTVVDDQNLFDSNRGRVTYRGGGRQISGTIYWRLPELFLGNKIMAYGGALNYTISFRGRGSPNGDADVVIKGNEIVLIHRVQRPLESDRDNFVTVDFYETAWTREDRQPATREHLMMALADLESLLIKWTYRSDQQPSDVSLGEVSMDIAVNLETQQERAWAVEECACPPGYKGLSCEECADGYVRTQGGLYLGTCEVARQSQCNEAGTLTTRPDGTCVCKAFTTGLYCDQCLRESFFLARENPHGCINCFCSGITRDCRSSNLYRSDVRLQPDQHELTVRTKEANGRGHVPRMQVRVDSSRRAFEVTTFDDQFRYQAFYFACPESYLGDRVTSYGGNLKYTIYFEGSGQDVPEPDVIIRGNDITLLYRHSGQVEPSREVQISIPIYETSWVREDGHPATREHLIMALADLNALLIKMTYRDSMRVARLSEVSIDIAVEQSTGRPTASAVEQCTCPIGYQGTSCQKCSPGYSRTGGGLYLGLCERCECYNHADECDTEGGYCKNCRHNTEGSNCHRCKAGYVGNPMRGTPQDCQPLTPRCFCNGHSQSCDSRGRCYNCRDNTEGDRCDQCKPGYTGDATRGTPHDCQRQQQCNCHGHSEQCDSRNGGRCIDCRHNTHGDHCQYCLPGYTGDATIGTPNDCRKEDKCNCNCHSEQCDHTTGRCYNCRHGTTGFRCGECAQGYYGFVRGQCSTAEDDCKKCPCPEGVPCREENGRPVCICPPGYQGEYCRDCASGYRNDERDPRICRPVELQARVSPRSQRVPPGSTVTLQCDLTERVGVMPYTRVWTRQGYSTLPRGATDHGTGTLTLTNVRPEDAGQYVCTVSSEGGTTSDVADLTVIHDAPRPVATPNIQTKSLGDTAEYTCSSSGDPPPQIAWSFGFAGGPLRPGITQDNGRLVISNIRETDEGQYFCTASNLAGTEVVTVQLFIEKEGPQIRIEPSKDKVATVGETFDIRCVATGKPDPQVSWSRVDRKPLGRNVQDAGNGVLRFTNFDPSTDLGEYECLAANAAGSATDRVNIRHHGIIIHIDPGVEVLSKNVGDRLELMCTATGEPQPRVEWIRDVGPSRGDLPAGHKPMETSEGRLVIPSLRAEDEGIYTCKADNGVERANKSIRILVVPPAAVQILEGAQSNGVIRVNVGERVELNCIKKDNRVQKLDWVRIDGRQPRTFRIEQEGKLIVDNIQQTDGGLYECVGNGADGVPIGRDRITVIVEALAYVVSIEGNGVRIVQKGDSFELKCSSPSSGDSKQLAFTWTNQQGQKLGDGRVLTLSPVTNEMAGTYVCTLHNTTTGQVLGSARGYLIVQDSKTAPGVELKWYYVKDGRDIPTRWSDSRGILYVTDIDRPETGTYKCVMLENGRKRGEETVTVVVQPKPDDTKNETFPRGATAELRCPVPYIPGMVITWRRSDGKPLPPGAEQLNELLRIPNFSTDYAGKYECQVEVQRQLVFGYIQVKVEETDVLSIEIASSKDVVYIGDYVTFNCKVVGDPTAIFEWEKPDGQISPFAKVDGGHLTIHVRSANDVGVYRCSALTRGNTRLSSDAAIYLSSAPQRPTTTTENPKHVHVGGQGARDRIITYTGTWETLICPVELAEGAKATAVLWTKVGGTVPPKAEQLNGTLIFDRVNRTDEGIYTCTVETETIAAKANVTLLVPDKVLYFPADGYAMLPALPKTSFNHYEITFSFRPDNADGIMFYTAEDKAGGDFVAFGLKDGKAHYTFDLGSGALVLESATPLRMGIWHTATIKRMDRKGTLIIDGEETVTQLSPGQYSELNLHGLVHLGGASPEAKLSRTGFTKGFVGCIALYKVDTRMYDLNTDVINSTADVTPCDVCEANGVDRKLCGETKDVHTGICLPANNTEGYRCFCQFGFSGPQCEKPPTSCRAPADYCKHGGRCIDDNSAIGYRCLCPMNATGVQCEIAMQIKDFLSFGSGDSYVSVDRPTPSESQLSVALTLKPDELKDSLIMYIPGDAYGQGDFLALILKDGHIELRYKKADAVYTVSNDAILEVGKWYEVEFYRQNNAVVLNVTGVNDRNTVSKSLTEDDQNNFGSLDICPCSSMHIGGAPSFVTISPILTALTSFKGCIASAMTVNGMPMELVNKAIDSAAVASCSVTEACVKLQPCGEGATCIDIDGGQYACQCPPGKAGRNCIGIENACDGIHCENGGTCVVNKESGTAQCQCPIGFYGELCKELTRMVETSAYFDGQSWVEFRKQLMPHMSSEETEVIEMEIRTNSTNRLIMWHGQGKDNSGSDQDYLSVGVNKDGKLVFSYELGGGPAHIISSNPINDNIIHKVKLTRTGRSGIMQIDDDAEVTQESKGILAMLNTEGNIFIGGMPDNSVNSVTKGRYTQNFIGCINNVRLLSRPLVYTTDSIGGTHLYKNCESA